MTADQIIARLGLQPHPEGGHYREMFRAAAGKDGRGASTAIFFLLKAGERSHWHRVDAEELWIFQAGAPLRLLVASDGVTVETLLGPGRTEAPQRLVHAGEWQAAEAELGWTLVSCVVVPGFRFEGFEMAPEGWSP